jgi:hypothetical protein
LKGHGFIGFGKLGIVPALYQGTALQAAEKLDSRPVLYQGTTLVVPQVQQNKRRALAPAGCFSGILLEFRPFSAACLAVP